jgi:hypothetical protein
VARTAPATCVPGATERLRALDDFRAREAPRYRQALARGTAWLDKLSLDPVALTQRGILGKRKLGDIVGAYHQLLKVSPDDQRAKLRQRATELLAPVAWPAYHDMGRISDSLFSEEISAYLLVASLAERLGLDTREYRKQIDAVRPRMDAQMAGRGPQVRKLLHWYYDQYGFAWPLPADEPTREWIVTIKPDVRVLTLEDAYRLTHEVFFMYPDVDRPEHDAFGDPEAAYLRNALPRLTRAALRKNETDIAAELVACMQLLRAFDVPGFLEGLTHVLDVQQPSGAWGQYSEIRQQHGADMEQLYQLHTTGVAILALTLAFHEPWNQGLTPRCKAP